jgi:4'-phosphopantetheinyl transferase
MLEFHDSAGASIERKVRALRAGFKHDSPEYVPRILWVDPGNGASMFARHIIDWTERKNRSFNNNSGLRAQHVGMMVSVDNRGTIRQSEFNACRIPLRQLELPRPGEVQVWYLDLRRLGLSLQHALSGPDDKGSYPPLTIGQLRFARRFYLKLLLGAYLGVPGKSVSINRSNRGKPVLDPGAHEIDLHFSMAKSGDRLLIGISVSSLVGVDLEPAERRAHYALGVARRYFSAAEARALENIAPERMDESFLRAWACKEAVVKASGEGIANQLCRFTVEMDPDQPPAILDFENEDAEQWSLALLQPEPGFIGAIAANISRMRVKAYQLLPAVSPSP